MFVAPADFIDFPYNLPKMNDADTQTAFQAFINRNEAIELRQVFGSDFYEAFTAALNALPTLWSAATNYLIGNQVLYGYDVYIALQNNVNVVPTSDATKWHLEVRSRWQKLWAGESYVDQNGAKQNWVGMKELVKPLIYALWLRDDIASSVQSNGVIRQQSENAYDITANFRFSDALQAYSLKIGKLDGAEKDTLYNYLFANAANFEDVCAAIAICENDFVNYLKYYFENPGFVNDFDI